MRYRLTRARTRLAICAAIGLGVSAPLAAMTINVVAGVLGG
jgi:hypothetical protein